MTLTYKTIGATLCGAALLMAAVTLRAQTAEVFTTTASVKGAGGGSASVPVTINVDRKMSQGEADKLAGRSRPVAQPHCARRSPAFPRRARFASAPAPPRRPASPSSV